jgi:hypothetical protein
MQQVIAVLDDDEGRLACMRRCLCGFPNLKAQFFDSAPDMIEWLRSHLGTVVAISLDHDLGPNRLREGLAFDPGTGRDVADFLAQYVPSCPVLICTTNSLARPGMELVLSDGGWQTTRVIPAGDLAWINREWMPALRTLIRPT